MKKIDELEKPNSCWNKAALQEQIFVILGHDVAAPATIRFWISERIRLGKNKPGDKQLIEAEDRAVAIEAEYGKAKNQSPKL